jgi:hypothetical protein
MTNQNDPQLVNPQTDQPQYVVGQWVRITFIAVINIAILAAFAAYFDNQSLGLLEVISIIADSMGIVLGLLGIWFFFLSERLNRSAALNLERTTRTVEDLRVQMWEMINKTFNMFVKNESAEQADEIRNDIEQLRNQIQQQDGAIPGEVLQTIENLNKRLDSIERRNQSLGTIATPRSQLSDLSNVGVPSRDILMTVISENIDKFPMRFKDLYLKLQKAGHGGPLVTDLAAKFPDLLRDVTPPDSADSRRFHQRLLDISPVLSKLLRDMDQAEN